MPELPEVETTTRGMRLTVLGTSITDFWCDWDNILRGITPAGLKKNIVGSSFVSVKRRGKNILAELSNGYTLVMHMKMTGHFMYGQYIYHKKTNTWSPKDMSLPLADPYNRFIHAVFTLSDDYHLVFCDARKFGKIELVETTRAREHARLSLLGPEPLEADFDLAMFVSRLARKERSTIKQTLLDQSVLAGVGNIYTDESLHRAGILPTTRVSDLTHIKLKKLHQSLKEVLAHGIEFGGDSTSDYRNIYGEAGGFHGTHKVYRRAGQACTKRSCKGIIQRSVVAARGTYHCPNCQN